MHKVSNDDNMERYYASNASHYDTGLVRIGCTEEQARAYAAYFRTFRGIYYKKIQQAYQILNRDRTSCIRVLDVGCGLGEDIRVLNSILPQAEFVGVELSPSAIEICERSAAPNMKFFCCDVGELPYSAHSFDLIINFCMLEHVASPISVLTACKNMLTTKGIIVSAIPNHCYWWSWYLPRYALMKLIGKKIKSHSVYRRIMRNSLQKLNLNLLCYDVVGFRPPQEFFCWIPARLIDPVFKSLRKIGDGLHATFLKTLLYLEIYVASPRDTASIKFFSTEVFEDGKEQFITSIISGTVSTMLAVPYYALWWIEVLRSTTKHIVTKIMEQNG